MRRALVTGGAGAIGSVIADALRATGHEVVTLDRQGCDVMCDLADHDAIVRAIADVGEIDVLVHAAATFEQASLAELELASWRKVQAVNVESALWLARALVPGMSARGFGRLVFVVSDTVWNPPAPEMLPYIASKATLIGVARSLARALGGDGITVNCVAPGLTRTPSAEQGVPDAAFDAARAQQSVKRTLVPDDVAQAVAYLASDAASAVSGQTLNVDGGLVLR